MPRKSYLFLETQDYLHYRTTSTFQIKNGSTVTKLSELENDTGFITNLVDNLLNYYTKSETYSKDEIDSVLSTLKAGIDVLKVEALPTENISTKTIYLLPTDKENVLTQWMYLNNNWESFGDTTLDLSNVYTIEQIDSKLLGYVTTTALTLALDAYAKNSDLAKVAFSGKYEDLEGLPSIPEIANAEVLAKFREINGKPYYDGKPIGEGSSGGDASLITVDKYTYLPTIDVMPSLTDKQIAVVYSEESLEMDENTIVYPRGFYIYNKTTDSWSKFKPQEETDILDVSDIILSLWNNESCSTNLGRLTTKETLELIMKGNNQKLVDKIDNAFEVASFDECNDMVNSISSILRGEE